MSGAFVSAYFSCTICSDISELWPDMIILPCVFSAYRNPQGSVMPPTDKDEQNTNETPFNGVI